MWDSCFSCAPRPFLLHSLTHSRHSLTPHFLPSLSPFSLSPSLSLSLLSLPLPLSLSLSLLASLFISLYLYLSLLSLSLPFSPSLYFSVSSLLLLSPLFTPHILSMRFLFFLEHLHPQSLTHPAPCSHIYQIGYI